MEKVLYQKLIFPFIQHASKIGIDIGNATNGWEFEKDKIDQILPYMKWIRFTVGSRNSGRICKNYV